MAERGASTTRRPRLADVARRAGVAVTTVSHVLNRRDDTWISDATRTKVIAIARELGYRPNALARSLRSQSTHTLGVIFPGMANQYLAEMAEAVYREARKRKYHVLLNPEEGAGSEVHVAATGHMLTQVVDGIVVFWPYDTWTFNEVDLLPPLVLIDTEATVPAGTGVDWVSVDRGQGTREVTARLLGSGRRRVCFVVPDRDDRVMRERIEGWRGAHQQAGVDVEEKLIFRVEAPEEWAIGLGLRIGQDLLANGAPPDAIIVVDDYWGVGIMKALLQAGLSVPDDVAVVGSGDYYVCEAAPVELASVAFPVEQMATAAVDMLIGRVEAAADSPREPARTQPFPMRFVQRDSCGIVVAHDKPAAVS